MALKQLNKRKSLDGLANVNKENKEFTKAALFRIDKDGNILQSKAGVFLLNPASLDDSKSSNWVENIVPGQSDPPLQWVSSGPRTVSFDALVTADTSYFDSGIITKPGEETDPLKKTLSFVGDIASSFFKVAVAPPRETAFQAATKGDSLDISEFLNYYRSLLYPTYDDAINPRRLRASPPLLILYQGSSVPKIKYEKRISAQHDLWVLVDLKIKITKQLPNLAPMEATVSFTLKQYNVKSFDRRRFSEQ
jgi:hypothetical protein